MVNFFRGRWGIVLFLLVAVITVGAIMRALIRGGDDIQQLRQAKFISFMVEGIPMAVRDTRPIEVMIGLAVKIGCERATPPAEQGKPRFKFQFGDETETHDDCDIERTFRGQPGAVVPVTVEYQLVRADGTSVTKDTINSTFHLVPGGPFLRLRALETVDKKPLEGLTVPQYVVPYVEAALQLTGKPEEYVAVFFLQEGEGEPLQLRVSSGADGKARPVTAAITPHRRHGPELMGYAGWPEQPIAIGEADEVRTMFTLYTAVVRKTDAEALFQKCCATAGGGVTTISGLRPEEVTAVAVDGRLSSPVAVVRAAAGGRASRAVLPVPPSGAPASAVPSIDPPNPVSQP